MGLEALAKCQDLTEEHIAAAAHASSAMRELLAWAEKTARPGEGAPEVLKPIARLVEAEWIAGTPFVEVVGDTSETRVSIFVDHGFGMRERVFPVVTLAAPFSEFVEAFAREPRFAAPLVLTREGDMLRLTAGGLSIDELEATRPIEIDASSLSDPHYASTKPPPPPAKSSSQEPGSKDLGGIHTHPTVRRMVAVVPEARRSRPDDE